MADRRGRESSRRRVVALVVVVVLAMLAAIGYVLHAAGRDHPVTTSAGSVAVGSVPGPRIEFRYSDLGTTYGLIGGMSTTSGERRVLSDGLQCDRVYASATRTLCLVARRGVVTTYEARLLDRELRPMATVALPGTPSRARLSADSRLAATTVFVSGHSYIDSGFSTSTLIFSAESGQVLAYLEDLRVVKDGRGYRSPDINFWGVTFDGTDGAFYATLATKGRTYLVHGDLTKRVITVLRENAECPSLSPDRRRIVYKKKVSGAGASTVWRLTLLDLGSGQETPLPETRSVDDQAEWQGNDTVLYGVPRSGAGNAAQSDIWASPIIGGPPRLIISGASSPTVLPS